MSSYTETEYKLYKDYAGKLENMDRAMKVVSEMSQDDMITVIKVADLLYNYPDQGRESLIADEVYDYIKEQIKPKKKKGKLRIIFGNKKRPNISMGRDPVKKPALAPKPKVAVAPAVRVNTHMPNLPKGTRNVVKTPYWLGSMDKMNHGEGEVAKWTAKFDGPYVVTAKMDGTSVLYYTAANGKDKILAVRAKQQHKCQDISNLIPYLNLPTDLDLPPLRGELIMRDSIFDSKYKKENDGDNRVNRFKNVRNTVPGIITHFNTHLFEPEKLKTPKKTIAADLEVVFYEVITEPLMKPSEQMTFLKDHGFTAVRHHCLKTINDDVLSDKLDLFLKEGDYGMDGLVVYNDQVYNRYDDGNPDYAIAYKKTLESLMAITTVNSVEWQVSRHHRMKPVVYVKPVKVDSVIIRRITGNNAKFIVEKLIGPGAKVQISRSGGVIPKILHVLEPVDKKDMQMPSIPYHWDKTETELLATVTDDQKSDTTDKIAVTRLHYFLKTIDAKGIGPKNVARIYHEADITDVVGLIEMTPDDIGFLGKTLPNKMTDSIKNALDNCSLATFIAASGVFDSGIGRRVMKSVLAEYPNLVELSQTKTPEQLVEILVGVDGIATITARVIAKGLTKFNKLLDRLPPSLVTKLTSNAQKQRKQAVAAAKPASQKMAGVRAYLTGGSNKDIEKFIVSNGGKVAAWSKSLTTMVIRKNNSINNNKTKLAEEKGLEMLDWDQFAKKYM